jgi:methionyl-tRNA formyltransferase
MMKIMLLTSSDVISLPAAIRLNNEDQLAGIIIPEMHAPVLQNCFQQNGISKNKVHTVSKNTFEIDLIQLLNQLHVTVIVVITFPWKLPVKLINAAKYCINLHPGKLPKYKGGDPLFWQIKNSEPSIALTAHLVTENIDAGPVIYEYQVTLTSADTYGNAAITISYAVEQMIVNLIEAISQSKIVLVKQADNNCNTFQRKPLKDQFTINWKTQSAHQINALVNACNPRYNGAITYINKKQLNILEISIINVTDPPAEAEPGQIIYADHVYGPVVACLNNQYIKINTACTNEGYLSGPKLFQLGLNRGLIFNSPPFVAT